LFTCRVLEQLFECHVQEHKNHLDESKMRHLLEVLRDDLGCGPGSGAERIHAGWEGFELLELQELDATEELEFSSNRQREATENEDLLGTLD
ncbi:Spermatogenesis-associated protein 7, partial [Mesitornis unicolor]